MKVNKIFTPLGSAAKALFKNTVGNDLGKNNLYLTNNIEQDIFIKEQKVKLVKSVNRRKW
ncbi:hypothetical protein J6I39_07015 [bacterium]|nr:hypothetical protein [bacterium]